MFSLFRLPLGAFRPHDLLYVYEEDGRLAGLVRVERETTRDEWTIVELDAIGHRPTPATSASASSSTSCARARKRGAARFHVACADDDGNVELFMQAGFARYGEERILSRAAGRDAARARGPTKRAAAAASGRSGRSTRCALHRLYRPVTPHPVARLEAIRLPDWERQGTHWRVPRSSLTPILRFADVEAFVQESPRRRQGRHAARRVPPGRRRQGGPAALPQGHRAARARRRPALIGFGLGIIAARTERGRRPPSRSRRHRPRANLRSAARSAPRGGMASTSIASVTLLMKETLVRVAEPALVPAGVR